MGVQRSMGSGPRRARLAAMGLLLCLAAGTAGCAARNMVRKAEREEAARNYDQAVLIYARLKAEHPEVNRYVIALARNRLKAGQLHLEKAKKYRAAGQQELAIGELLQVVTLDPGNSYAQTELEHAQREWQRERDQVQLTDLEIMKQKALKEQGVPLLDPRSNIPVMLSFRDAEVGKIYDALSKATGINFLYDPKLDLKQKKTIELTNVPFEKAVGTLMFTNKHFFKVMDENTIVIADDNQQKRREYEDEVIKTFFLSNADVKDVQTLLRTTLDMRKLVQNNQLNAITIRDTPNKVAIAAKIIEANDKAKGELIVDVELLEVSRTVSRTLGINLTPRQYSIKWTGPADVPLNNLGILKQAGLYTLGPIPSVTIDFLKSDSGTKTIAKPSLRVTEGEKANLHIGDSVPIPTTTFNTTGSVGGSVVPITSFTYQEVGIVIEIEPRVHHNKEITLKLNVEVSQLGASVNAGQGISQPAINSRQINTVIRLKDGETNLLAGLIADEGTVAKGGFAGLMDVPGLGDIFSTRTDTTRSTDLILTLTPHILRIPDIREEDLEALWIGNESNPHLRGDAGSVFATPFTSNGEVAAEEEEEEEAEEISVLPASDQQKPAQPPAGQQMTPPAPVPPRGQQAATPIEEEIVEDDDWGDEDEGDQEAVPLTGPAMTPPAGTPAPPAQQPGGQQQPGEIPNQVPRQQAGPMNLTIAPARLTVAAGGAFSVNLLVNNVVNLQKVSMTLTYDPAAVDFDSALEGIIMKQDGTQTLFSATKVADGQVALEVARLGGSQGISRGGALAALRFRATAPGKSTVAISQMRAEAFDGSAVMVNLSTAEITVSN